MSSAQKVWMKQKNVPVNIWAEPTRSKRCILYAVKNPAQSTNYVSKHRSLEYLPRPFRFISNALKTSSALNQKKKSTFWLIKHDLNSYKRHEQTESQFAAHLLLWNHGVKFWCWKNRFRIGVAENMAYCRAETLMHGTHPLSLNGGLRSIIVCNNVCT